MPNLKKGATLEVEIEKFADKGKSLARINGQVLFVTGAVPGDVVIVRVTRAKKSYAEGRTLELRRPSPLRTEPRCRYFGTCGGCKWQHVAYAAQLEAKQQSVEEAFTHHGHFRDVHVLPTLGSEDVYFYRNKMEFSFSAARWLTREEIESKEAFDTGFALGLHVPGDYRKVLDLHECHLQSELSVRIVNGVRELSRQHGWAPWDVDAQTGYLRHLVIRQAARTTDVMVNLVTNGETADRISLVANYLRSRFPEVTTFVNTINTGLGQSAFGERTTVSFGSGVIRDRIGPHIFELSSNAFFQTNTHQAERMYGVVRQFADLTPNDLVYDLYSGVGTISLFLADSVQKVVGVEMIPEAVDNARVNARLNGVENCDFVAGDMLRRFRADFVKEHGRPDVVVVDPPRAGIHPRVVEQIGRLRPERFVYVSCNPATQVRDLAALAGLYDVVQVQPVDLFPHTHHVESVAQLRLK